MHPHSFRNTLALLLALAPIAAARADVVTIPASHDASIYSNKPNNSNGAGPGLFAGTDGAPQNLRSLIQFDVAGTVPAGSTITDASLTLTLGTFAGDGTAQADTAARSIELHRLTVSWGEGTTLSTTTQISQTGQGAAANPGDATWSSRFFSPTTPTAWTTPGGDFAAQVSAKVDDVGTTDNTPCTWPSTPALVADLQSWLDTPSTNAGWLLRNADEAPASRTFRAFWSRQAPTPAFRPQLQITFTPLPEPAFAAPLLALAFIARRTRRPVPWASSPCVNRPTVELFGLQAFPSSR